MSVDHNEKYIFEAEWYDKIAAILKNFYLYYYPYDNTVELVGYRYFIMFIVLYVNI